MIVEVLDKHPIDFLEIFDEHLKCCGREREATQFHSEQHLTFVSRAFPWLG